MAYHDEDFGFSMVDATNVERLKAININATEDADFYKQNMLEIRNLIMPLLQNLAKDPEKDIHWPNRDTKLKSVIDKVNAIVARKPRD